VPKPTPESSSVPESTPLARPGRKAPRVATPTIARTAELIPGIHAEIPPTGMRVGKRNGTLDAVTVDKIIRAVERCSVGLASVDPMRALISRRDLTLPSPSESYLLSSLLGSRVAHPSRFSR
jgi:hypothetical protein